MKRYLIEFNTNDDEEVSVFIGQLLIGGKATSLKVQVFTEEEAESDETNSESPKAKLNLSERREKVYALKQKGFANNVIAKKLKVAVNTVYNDLTYWRHKGYEI